MKSIESREARRNLLAIVIPILLVLAAVSAVLVLTSGGSPPAALGSSPEVTVSTVEADVVLYAPFNGTTVSVVATVSTNVSTPLVETLAAQYSPTGNGSTAVFSSYYGTFDAAEVNLTSGPQGLNLTLTVRYGEITGSANASVDPDEGEVVIPIIMGTVPQLPAENMTVSNGATDCASLGASWNADDATCIVDVPTEITSLTIGYGVTFVNDAFLVDVANPTTALVDVANTTTAFSNFGNFVNNGFMSAGLDNYGVYDNYGTLDNSYGTLYNYGTISNYGTITNNFGTIYNVDTILNGVGSTINNYGGTIYNHGTIDNYGTLDNPGNILNKGGLIIINNRYYPGRLIGNQPIGGTVLYS